MGSSVVVVVDDVVVVDVVDDVDVVVDVVVVVVVVVEDEFIVRLWAGDSGEYIRVIGSTLDDVKAVVLVVVMTEEFSKEGIDDKEVAGSGVVVVDVDEDVDVVVVVVVVVVDKSRGIAVLVLVDVSAVTCEIVGNKHSQTQRVQYIWPR